MGDAGKGSNSRPFFSTVIKPLHLPQISHFPKCPSQQSYKYEKPKGTKIKIRYPQHPDYKEVKEKTERKKGRIAEEITHTPQVL
ncbi:hypothetical protein RJT34_30352 [Clitoria ternatea]|uniref:Uncharacterized protein n=1 Tax=Clitoria ternatea TaxID=43366 RepID=A0AAN9ES72_CLITE